MTMNFNIDKKSQLTKKDMLQVFMRSCTLDSAWNYERQQNLMYCYAMIPVLKRLYGSDKNSMSEALKRHLEFMACTPHIVTLLLGICTAMEEKAANEETFDKSGISAVKMSLMGPLAGIGDSFFWGTLLTIAIGVAVSFSQHGSIIGPISFFLIINIPGFFCRYICLEKGYKYGIKFFGNFSDNSIISIMTKSASILGLMVIGAMSASTISISLPLEIGVEGNTIPLQNYFDEIMPGLLSAIVFGIMYWLLGKKIKPTKILLGIIIVSCIGRYLKLL